MWFGRQINYCNSSCYSYNTYACTHDLEVGVAKSNSAASRRSVETVEPRVEAMAASFSTILVDLLGSWKPVSG